MKQPYQPPRLSGKPPRTPALVFLTLWIGVALWGWFFVDPNLLSHSPLALRFVDAIITFVPWLEGVRAMGIATDRLTVVWLEPPAPSDTV